MEFEKLKKIIAEVCDVDEDKITMDSTFKDDLDADSLDVFQIVTAIEDGGKPITARKCIKSLPKLAEAKPNLMPHIASSLRQADTSQYTDSMRPLIQNDIRDALLALDSMQ